MTKGKKVERCSNCGKLIKGMAAMFPTVNKKRRQQCKECAEKWLSSKNNLNNPISPQAKIKEWKKEMLFHAEHLIWVGRNSKEVKKDFYIKQLVAFIQQLLSQQREEIREKVKGMRIPSLLKGDWKRDKSGKPMGTLSYDKGSFRENIGYNKALKEVKDILSTKPKTKEEE